MNRIRTVKPEWLDDERLSEASADARVLSIALLLLSDDYGNGRAGLNQLAGRVFPGKPRETLAKALDELRSISYVHLYEVDDQRYFHIRNWDKHQRVDKPGRPRVPPPSEPSENIPETAENFRASRGSRSRSLPDPDPGLGTGQARVSPSVTQRDKSPSNLSEALQVPAQERAQLVERDPSMAQWLEPEKWPEVVAVAQVFESRRCGAYKRDSGVRAVVGCLADGYTQNELTEAARALRGGATWAKGRTVGMSTLTPEVLSRQKLQGKQDDRTPEEILEDELYAAKQRARAVG